jgi:hypothetical protein
MKTQNDSNTAKTPPSIVESAIPVALITPGILMIPLVAMQFTAEVDWSIADFVIMGTILFATGMTYQLVTRTSGDLAYRLAVGSALVVGFLTIWVNLAVGIIGSEDNAINLLYFAALLVGFVAALIARFNAGKMVYVAGFMAFSCALIAGIALFADAYDTTQPDGSVFHVLGVNGFFMALWASSAMVFRHAEREGGKINNER